MTTKFIDTGELRRRAEEYERIAQEHEENAQEFYVDYSDWNGTQSREDIQYELSNAEEALGHIRTLRQQHAALERDVNVAQESMKVWEDDIYTAENAIATDLKNEEEIVLDAIRQLRSLTPGEDKSTSLKTKTSAHDVYR